MDQGIKSRMRNFKSKSSLSILQKDLLPRKFKKFARFLNSCLMPKFLLLCGAFLWGNLVLAQVRKITTLQVPALTEYCTINLTGKSVLPSGRYVTPAGKTLRIARSPFGLKLSPDGKKALILHHNGMITQASGLPESREMKQVPAFGQKDSLLLNGFTFLGLDFSADSRTAFLSGGDKGNVILLDVNTFKKTGEIKLDGLFNGITYEDSFTSDLVFNPQQNELLISDRANFRLVRYSLSQNKITASIKTGRIPFGIALSPDKKTAFVANVGLYEYPAVPGVTPKNKDTFMLRFPPYGIPSREAEAGLTLPDGRKIPGLGKTSVEEAMSVWMINLADNQVTGKFKTGFEIGEMIEEAEITGGSSPNSLAVGQYFAYVTNATNDNISIIDHRNRRLLGEIQLHFDKRLDKFRGLMPFGICLSADERTLYVACLGLNAVAVVDTRTRQTKGFIPTGWGTTRVLLTKDEKHLLITAARGYGAGPNGGKDFKAPPQGTYIGDIQLGTLQVVPVPDEKQLVAYTQQVRDNTFREVIIADNDKNPLPVLPGKKSPIRHIVYITKENRTYDEVFGQIRQAKGDSTLARFGLNVDVTKISPTLQGGQGGASVSPNHHKIARQFALSDNFYCDSDASIHGHHWMVGQMVNEYVEANSASEGRFNTFSKAPGRRFPKATGGIDPEDYNEKGGLWENMARHNISFYNFGEANEYAGVEEEANHTPFGVASPTVMPLPKVLFDRTCRNYAGFNMNISDQFRMDQFEEEFTRMWLSGKDTMPALIAMQVPQDHGGDIKAAEGYPFPHSYLADNDLALGRILHFLSRTKYWKNTLVIITEDDPQGGVDHVDAHRSVLLMAGPYVKKNYVSHTHANFGSLLRTIYNLTGAGYVNQYDATASLLQDFFTDKPDFSPYTAELPDSRIFDPQKVLNKYNKTFDWRKIQQGPAMDNEKKIRQEHYREQK
jgi:hypothetical protein